MEMVTTFCTSIYHRQIQSFLQTGHKVIHNLTEKYPFNNGILNNSLVKEHRGGNVFRAGKDEEWSFFEPIKTESDLSYSLKTIITTTALIFCMLMIVW